MWDVLSIILLAYGNEIPIDYTDSIIEGEIILFC